MLVSRSSLSSNASPVTTSESTSRTPAISRARNSVSDCVRSLTCRSTSDWDAVAGLLPVLGQQDERRGVRRLQRQQQGEQREPRLHGSNGPGSREHRFQRATATMTADCHTR